MKLPPIQAPTLSTSALPALPAPTQTSVAGANGSDYVAQAPTGESTTPPADSHGVPKGQLERTRAGIPAGWMNDGGHNGFKPAVISQVVEGYHLAAVNPGDVPRGRQ